MKDHLKTGPLSFKRNWIFMIIFFMKDNSCVGKITVLSVASHTTSQRHFSPGEPRDASQMHGVKKTEDFCVWLSEVFPVRQRSFQDWWINYLSWKQKWLHVIIMWTLHTWIYKVFHAPTLITADPSRKASYLENLLSTFFLVHYFYWRIIATAHSLRKFEEHDSVKRALNTPETGIS